LGTTLLTFSREVGENSREADKDANGANAQFVVQSENSMSESGMLPYRRVDPLEYRREATWDQVGNTLTITIPSSKPVRRIIGLSLAVFISVGLGIACWLIASVYDSDVRPLLVIPAAMIVWTICRLIYAALYGATPTVIRVWPKGVEITGLTDGKPARPIFPREWILDLDVFPINTEPGRSAFLQVKLNDRKVYVTPLPEGSQRSIPAMREAIRGILKLT
jgi:hypothetical protein